MKFFQEISVLLASAVTLGVPVGAWAEPAPEADKTLSPYFFVMSDDPAKDRLPLKSTDVKVNITGVIADVTVTQHYRNEGSRPLEARYVFPASTQAAVYAMKMRLGERVVEAKIREKQQARVEYETAKKEGKSASLLEQERANVFQMNVANILPGDDIVVELRYTETIVPSEGKYQFVYPTVVGPRYNGSVASGSGVAQQWVATPYQHEGETPKATFGMVIAIASPIPLQAVSTATHKVQLSKSDERHANIVLPADVANGNRDFILDFRLAGNTIQTGALLYKGKDENFFMAMVEPPARVTSKEIVPREYIFIVDVSGSMSGFPLDTSKALLRDLVDHLKPTDTFNVMLFSGDNSMMAPNSLPATRDNLDKAIFLINQQRGGGGTELLPALRHALSLPRADNRSRNFVVVTDGYVTIEKEAFDLVRANLNNANVFSFGIGSSVNRLLMEGLARAGQGEAFIVTNNSVAEVEAKRFRQYIESPVWTHLQLKINGLEAYDIEPAKLPDLFANRPLVVIGKWRGQPTGTLTVEGHAGNGLFSRTLRLNETQVTENASALRYLWARKRIGELSDDTKFGRGDETLVREITDLGLKYNLLTEYTSFVAVDHVVRTHEKSDTVDQPNPLPEGVGDLAVGGEVPSTPEPEFYTMLAGLGLVGVWLRRRKNHAAK